MLIPDHNYSSYKKQSSLNYFTELVRGKKPKQNRSNTIYKTMKNYSMIYKIFKNFNSQPKQKLINRGQTISTISGNRHSLIKLNNQTHYPIIFKNNFAEKKLSFIKLQPHTQQKQKQFLITRQKRSKTTNVERTTMQIMQIHSNVQKFHTKLGNNKKQIKLITQYHDSMDKYYDQLPSPTASVSRQSMRQNIQLRKFCQQDIFSKMQKQQKKTKQQEMEEYKQPEIPENVLNRLVEENKNQIREKKLMKQQKTNKVELRCKFLEKYKNNKWNKVLNKQNSTAEVNRIIPSIIKRRNRHMEQIQKADK